MKKIEVSEHEENLLKYIKQVGYGRFTVFVQDGQPLRSEEGIKSTKF